ncbi:hypothetical protein G7K_1307-t1 [Saitoella complicata NRRL Y-17804]|uniref:R3H domain-containing protein n=1 Tax=Saitoella complicata (strain BCRC 22490 / CBS 7301 / JCM 7358 / NBRC 10748 / NRRL Y-17804) TaxID=698492 RepID=A0A0E9NCF3_SAICN|nr:hypothetical protein G7K_1307-t1 [Saitoella complicata NRRL Y-17804]
MEYIVPVLPVVRATAKWALAIGATTLAITGALLYTFQNSIIYPASMPAGSRTNVPNPSDFDFPSSCWEEIVLDTPDKEKIRAYVILQEKAPEKRNTVLLFHANAGNVGHRLPIAKVFWGRMGCNVVMLSYRGYGLSTGTPSEKGIKIDAQVMLDYVLQHPVLSKTPLIAYGQSIGGAVAIHTVATYEKKFRGLVIENTFKSIPSLIPSVMPIAAPFSLLCHQIWDSEKCIAKIENVPMLFLAGARDELIPPENFRGLYDAATKCPKRTWKVFGGGTHNDTCLQAGYFQAIVDWLDCEREKEEIRGLQSSVYFGELATKRQKHQEAIFGQGVAFIPVIPLHQQHSISAMDSSVATQSLPNGPPPSQTPAPRNKRRGPRRNKPANEQNGDAQEQQPAGGEQPQQQRRPPRQRQPKENAGENAIEDVEVNGEAASTKPKRPRNRNRRAKGVQAAAAEGEAPAEGSAAPPVQQQAQQPRPRQPMPGRRQHVFSGQLSGEAGAPTNGPRSLQPMAPAFVPSQVEFGQRARPHTHNRSVPAMSNEAKVELTESTDLMTRLHEGLKRECHECMFCLDNIRLSQQTWSCTGSCWAVFHLKCITKWAKSSLEMKEGTTEAKENWRCPGCQQTYGRAEVPKQYKCWCGKVENPVVDRFLTPHSCGEICGRGRSDGCPHACTLPCHAGPCPPCTAMGPVQTCFCGKHTKQVRCVDTDYEKGYGCGERCGELMACGEHECERDCHEGLCGSCTAVSEEMCYCGKEVKGVACGERLDDRTSRKDGEEWCGKWECQNACERAFDCGVHKCQKACHPLDEEVAKCPQSPEVVDSCPCGQTKLEDLEDAPRTRCTDPIPTCRKQCNALLECGHTCEARCHHGEHPVCKKSIELPCRCGSSMTETNCQEIAEGFEPRCERTCHALRSCGKHECSQKCCAGAPKAEKRIAARKGMGRAAARLARDYEDVEAEHVCTLTCGKQLQCGNHTCQLLCHPSYCPSCLEASFEELVCHCGRTRIMPPLPCGYKLPPCPHPCKRRKACGHPSVPHNCHPDEEKCPRCPYLTEKRCLCQKKMVKNVPCWKEEASCGEICGKLLKCGGHRCRKLCHAGECETECTQVCGKPRKTCGHPCGEQCHSPFACPEDEKHRCKARVVTTCACGTVRQEVVCGASTKTETTGKKELPCTEKCDKLQRNKRMAEALGVDGDKTSEVALSVYTDDILEYYRTNKLWATSIENSLKTFVAGDKKMLSFKPMKRAQRGFVHAMAEAYGMTSQSQDPDPFRNVVVTRTSNTIVPLTTLAQAATSRTNSGAATPSGLQQMQTKTTSKAYNAFYLEAVRIGTEQAELARVLEPALGPSPLKFSIKWVTDEDVLLEPLPSSLSVIEVEVALASIKPSLKRVVASTGIAMFAELCWIGRDGKVSYRESTKVAGASGAGAWGKKLTPATTSIANAFSMLNLAGPPEQRASASSWRKPVEVPEVKPVANEPVLDDWQAMIDPEELISPEEEREFLDRLD